MNHRARLLEAGISRLLLVSLLLIANSQFSHAAVLTYQVTGVFYEPAAFNTVFNGSFDWDGSTVSNLHGTMNSSMYEINNVNPDYSNSFPLLQLNYLLAQSADRNIVTVSVFKENTTKVFSGGGYKTGDDVAYGEPYYDEKGVFRHDEVRNDNAYFTFAFDKTTMTGILDDMVYADCTPGGMMGSSCMTGHKYIGSMGAWPGTIDITLALAPVAVPLPAAAWLFLSALMGFLGLQRRRHPG